MALPDANRVRPLVLPHHVNPAVRTRNVASNDVCFIGAAAFAPIGRIRDLLDTLTGVRPYSVVHAVVLYQPSATCVRRAAVGGWIIDTDIDTVRTDYFRVR